MMFKEDGVRGVAPFKYVHRKTAVERRLEAIAREMSDNGSMAPADVLAVLEPDLDCSGMTELEKCVAASRALVKSFSEPVAARKPESPRKKHPDLLSDSTATDLINALSKTVSPFVVLSSKSHNGTGRVIETLAWRCKRGERVPSFLEGREVRKINPDALELDDNVFFDGDDDYGPLPDLPFIDLGDDNDEDSEDQLVYKTESPTDTAERHNEPQENTEETDEPDGKQIIDLSDSHDAWSLWSSEYSCFDPGSIILATDNPTATSILASQPMMTPMIVVDLSDDGSDISHETWDLSISEEDVSVIEMPVHADVTVGAKILYDDLLESRDYWIDRYGTFPSYKIVELFSKACASWSTIESYDSKTVVEMLEDCWSTLGGTGKKIDLKNAIAWLKMYCHVDIDKVNKSNLLMHKADKDALEKSRAAVKMRSMKNHPSSTAGKTTAPVRSLPDRETLLAAMEKRVIGQDKALAQIVSPIVRRAAGLSDESKPIASLLLAGPSGVGKTETAKAIAECCFGSESSLLRIDCSELYKDHMISRLLGSPAGYVGHDEGGQLLNWVDKHHSGVLLLDEIEKAHSSIYDSLLIPLLDRGQLTGSVSVEIQDKDGSKKRVVQTKDVDCTDLIIIMTSNLGSQKVSNRGMRGLGFGGDVTDRGETDRKLEEEIRSAVDHEFKTEIRNRINKVIVYRPLSLSALEQIFYKKWSAVDSKAKLQGVDVKLDNDVARWFVSNAHVDKYGARPLDRMIGEKLIDPLADIVLAERARNDGKWKHEVKRPVFVSVSISGDDIRLDVKTHDGEESAEDDK